MYLKNNLIQFTVIACSIIVTMLGVIFTSETIVFIGCLLIWILNVSMGCSKYKENIVFLSFNITFFFFLMGQYFVNYIMKINIDILSDRDTVIKTMIMLYVSLLTCHLSYFTYKKHSIRLSIPIFFKNNNIQIEMIRKIATIVFYFSYPFAIYSTIVNNMYVMIVGYARSYLGTSGVSGLVSQIVAVNEICFFMIAACLPLKKKFVFPAILFLVNSCLGVLSGRRNTVILAILFVVIYYVMRQKNSEYEVWIGKFEKTILILAIPVIAIYIVVYGDLRVGEAYNFSSVFDSLVETISVQGGSVQVLYYQQVYKNSEALNQFFVLGPLWRVFFQNAISYRLFNIPYYIANTTSMALHGHAFSQSISYCVNSTALLHGYGIGSCYIAEAMQDFGWIGIVLINVLYGIVMKSTTRISDDMGYFKRLYLCFLINKLIYSPRDGAMNPFFDIFSFSTFSVIIVLLLAAYLFTYSGNKLSVSDRD